MENENAYQAPGSIKISQDVVASIAKFVALEIDGVESISAGRGVKGLLARVNYVKPIRVQFGDDDVVTVGIDIVAKNGVYIPEVAGVVQRNIKNAIQNMTGLAVSRVDVVVAGTASEATDAAE